MHLLPPLPSPPAASVSVSEAAAREALLTQKQPVHGEG